MTKRDWRSTPQTSHVTRMARFVLGALAASAALLASSAVDSAEAAVVTRTIEYEHEGTTLEGFLAYDDAVTGSRPGVVIVHQWMGLTDNERMRARMLAEMGYVAFAADIYGKGIRPKNQQEAAAEAGKHYGNLALLRQRAQAAVDVIKGDAHLIGGDDKIFQSVDDSRVGAIGYCFGGGAVLQLAKSGSDIAGVVSFHGSLGGGEPDDAKSIKCPLLVLHGAEDPYVPQDQVLAFLDEMKAANVDFQFVAYSGAVHAFTQKEAGDDKSRGAAYNEKADHRSWQAMKDFFAEIF
ncbi:MAG: dienelactone hydrolase family protein [Candidatus Eisenbacteria bacterium]